MNNLHSYHELGHIKRWKDLILIIYFLLPFTLVAPSVFIVLNLLFYFKIRFLGILLPLLFTFLLLRFFLLDQMIELKMKSEFEADRISAELGTAKALISALKKTEEYAKKQPISRIQGQIGNLIATIYWAKHPSHPSTEERIKNIEDISFKDAFQ
ncbi:MAG: M48 family metalloprotease [Candidatus Methanoperedens sp.]|nr:M48 family metalloprotease [Candidatus Methanoperedens sp.]